MPQWPLPNCSGHNSIWKTSIERLSIDVVTYDLRTSAHHSRIFFENFYSFAEDMGSWGSWVLMTIAILLLLIWLAIWFCDRTWPKTETTEYRVAMSNRLMIVSFCVYQFIKSNTFCRSHTLCYYNFGFTGFRKRTDWSTRFTLLTLQIHRNGRNGLLY